MKKDIFIIYCLFLLMLSSSCSQPRRSDIIGKWKSEDNSTFQFKEDSTFIVKDVPKSIIFGHIDSKKNFSDTGKWEIREYYSSYRIELLFPKSSELPGGFVTYLNIEREFGIGKLNLFFWGKDFDYKYVYSKK